MVVEVFELEKHLASPLLPKNRQCRIDAVLILSGVLTRRLNRDKLYAVAWYEKSYYSTKIRQGGQYRVLPRVAIVGIGFTPFQTITPDVSFKEMMFEAATKAYEDAGVCPQHDIDGFVTCEEDFAHGRSIFSIHTPDNLRAVLKPIHTIPGDGIHGLIAGYMQISTGLMDIVAVESHSKASNMLTTNYLIALALDPVYNNPLGYNPYFITGMEMNRYLYETGTTKEQCALVAVKNRLNALLNPQAAYGERITVDEALDSEIMFYPLSRLDVSCPADGGIVMVLASEEKAKTLSDTPIWIRGVGWCSGAPSLETSEGVENASRQSCSG